MGKFILCSGTRAEEPLRVEMTDTILYTIEEFCYYLYQHIYLITEDFFTEPVISWIETQLNMKELAAKLRELGRTGGTVKDKVICILCSTDYYTEKEMKELIVVMNKMDGLPLIKRRKIKADIYVQYERYLYAAKEYEDILNSKEASILTAAEYGNLLHNYAIVLLYIGSLKEAAAKFKEAYQSNQNPESLKEYLMVLKMMPDSEEFEKERKDLLVSDELMEEVERIFLEAASMELNNPYHIIYRKLSEWKENSDVLKFFQETDRVLEQWINEYRNKVS